MDILSGEGALEDFRNSFTEAFGTEVSEWTSSEFQMQTRINAHQSAFAERFSERASAAWDDLLFLQPLAATLLAGRIQDEIGTGDNRTAVESVEAGSLLHFGIHKWMEKYAIKTSWVHAMAFTTVRAFALSELFSVPPPSTLLHNAFPTLVIEGDNVELGQSTFTVTPWSTVTVCPDLGPQDWDTIAESESQFKKRLKAAFAEKLEDQLSRVDQTTNADDLKVNLHWVDMTIDRYAAHKSERATAQNHNMSRPMVNKAVEAVRVVLGFEKLPPNSGATSPKRWRLHAT